MANEVNDQVQWDDQVDTSALKTKATPALKSSIQWHDAKDTTALEDPERYALTHPETGVLPQAAKSSYEVRPVLPSGERVGLMQARADEAPGTVGEQQAIARREAEHPLITAAVKAPAKMGTAGAEFGKKVGANIIPASDLIAEDVGLGNGHPQTEAESRAESPRLTGALEGVGETAGGLVADPTNWLLAATGAEAGPVLGKVASAVFAAKMGKDTYEGTKQLISDWDKLTPEERSAQVTKLGISGILTGVTTVHAAGGAPELIKTGAEKAKGLIPDNRVVDLLKQEAKAKIVPFNERFGINKPTFKDWKNAFKPIETEEVPTGAEPLIPEKTAKPSRGKLSDLIVDEHGNVVDKTAKPVGPSTRENYVQNLIEEGLTAKEPAHPRIELPTEEAKPESQGRVESGVSPPAVPNEPSAAHPAELIPEAKTTEAKPTAKLIPEHEPGLMNAGEEGREPARSADEYHPQVQEQVFNLGNDNLKKLAQAHGIDPTEDQYAFGKGVKRTEATDTSSGRQQSGRKALAEAVTSAMTDEEKINIGRNAEDLSHNADMAGKTKAERAESLFPRLRNLEVMSPRELHQNLGFGERNVGVTKEGFEAAKKSFNDKATRSNGGVDPTMLVDAAKIAAYYFEGGVREFAAFSSEMVARLGESIKPHLEELYARAKAGAPPTWKDTAEAWTTARAKVDDNAALSKFDKNLRKGNLPKEMGGPEHEGVQEQQWLAGGKGPDFAGETTPSKMERYTDPDGQFYKTVLKELRKATTPDAASDLAQDVMADFTENVKNGSFKLPENTSEEGRVTDNLKSIAKNKAADWADQVSGQTKGGTPRNLIDTKRMSETEATAKGSTGPRLAEPQIGEDEEVSPNRPEERTSPYGFGEDASLRNEHSNAQRALNEYLKEHPETAAEDKGLLLSASKLSLEKAEAARSKAFEAEFAKSKDYTKAIEAGRLAEARVNANKFTATDRYFGLTDAEMTKLGQSAHMTGTKFRARLTEIMDDLNGRAEKGAAPTARRIENPANTWMSPGNAEGPPELIPTKPTKLELRTPADRLKSPDTRTNARGQEERFKPIQTHKEFTGKANEPVPFTGGDKAIGESTADWKIRKDVPSSGLPPIVESPFGVGTEEIIPTPWKSRAEKGVPTRGAFPTIETLEGPATEQNGIAKMPESIKPPTFPKEGEVREYKESTQTTGKDVPSGTAEAESRLQKAQEAYDKIPKPKRPPMSAEYENAKAELDAAQAALDALKPARRAIEGRSIAGFPRLSGETQAIPHYEQPAPTGGELIPDVVRGGRTGTTPINEKVAAANSQRLAELRVAEAEENLSKADTPAKQRTARTELENAKDKLNEHNILRRPVSGGSQGAVARVEQLIPDAANTVRGVQSEANRFGVDLSPNASGESAASRESINRLASEKSKGLKRIVIDIRSGAEKPLIGVDAVDYAPRPYERVEFQGGNRDGEIISQGSKVPKRGMPTIHH